MRAAREYAPEHDGTSDQDAATEHALMRELNEARRVMDEVIRRINGYSGLVKIDERAWADFCADGLPDPAVWDERIEDARRGW